MGQLPIVNPVADHAASGGKKGCGSGQPRATPTVRALQALWRELEHEPVWAPRRFFRRLLLRRRMRLSALHQKDVRVVAPPGKINDCASCSDSCCIGVHSTVLLRLSDVARLVDIGRTDWMTQTKPTFTEQQLRASNALCRHTRSWAWRTFPVLKQNAFGACVALDAEGLCRLYPFWPQSCANFPYALDLEASEIFFGSRCRSFVIHPSRAPLVQQMAAGALAGYNERIKDAVLLAFRRDALRELGLLDHLTL